MNIKKNSEVSTSLIKDFVKQTKMEYTLNDVERRFLGFDFSTDSLSLTDNQDIEHQLRFYEKSYGLSLVNSITIKLVERTKVGEKVVINLYELSELEEFFLNRLEKIKPGDWNFEYKNIQHKILPVDYTYKAMRLYQNIGDTWTARIISDFLLKSDALISKNSRSLRDISFNYFGLDDIFATKAIILEAVKLKAETAEENNILVSGMYILSLLYSRHLPKPFRDFDKSASYLNKAYEIILNEEIPVENRLFEKVFNRNGYAFILFFEKKYNETVSLMLSLIDEIKPVVRENSFSKLHLAVLMYNLFQVYNLSGNTERAQATITELFLLDPNDVEYKYDYIRFLFENGRAEETKEILDDLQENNIGDPVFQNSYYAQYFMVLDQFEKALPFAYKAVIYNYDKAQSNRFLYNYIIAALNIGCKIDTSFILNNLEDKEEFYKETKNLIDQYVGNEV